MDLRARSAGTKDALPEDLGWVLMPDLTASATDSGVARSTGFWCTTATGACSQRPTQGAGITRTLDGSEPRADCSLLMRFWAPPISQLRPSQTRTVRPGAWASPLITSKW